MAVQRFAIAVSFPVEHRRFVRNVVARLAEVLGRDRIFYDEWYEAELAGLDGDLKLQRYYREQSRLIVPFFSEHYKKPWCEIEWHSIRTMLKDRRVEDAVVPVRMDGTQIDGWESIDFAIRRKNRSGKVIANLILAAYRNRYPGESTTFTLGVEPKASRLSSTPTFDNEEIRALSQELEEALARKLDLASREEDISAVVDEILSLKRRLREGGELRAGDVLSDRFQLLKRVGGGGFATFWKAADRLRHEVVAVKVLHGQYRFDRTRRERFFRGAREMAALRHPGIVAVLEDHLEDGGWHFFVMEFLPGGDLRQAVRSEILDVKACIRAVIEVGEALAYAHGRGVVHRDVKPANILLDSDGRAKLTDFDLVRATTTTGGTRTGMLGTAIFAAPEMLGKAKEAGSAADVYGLGITAAYVLYGEDLPFDALRDAPSFVRSLEGPSGVLEAIGSAVNIDPRERPKVSDFCARLRATSIARPLYGQPTPSQSGRWGTRVSSERPPAEAEAGDEWLNPIDGTVLVCVPYKEYSLGSDEIDEASKPVHRIRLSGFWIAKYPVTNEQYRLFLADEAEQELPEYWNVRRFNQPRQPVVGVGWDEAVAYCRWAGLELPSEAEWEAAARGIDGRRYPWGDQKPTRELANFSRHEGRTTAVDSYPAGIGPYGTFGQAGNVWEWCADVWAKRAYADREGECDPFYERGKASVRVVRGGSWNDGSWSLRTAFRDGYRISSRYSSLGFRCVYRCSGES